MTKLVGEKIVFMPGLDGTGISFEPLASLLPPTVGVTVIRYPNKIQSFEETVNCAAAQFPANEDVLVIAESFSGPLAIELIGSGKVKAKGLVLAATFSCSPRERLLPLFCFLPLNALFSLPLPALFLRVLLGDRVRNLKPMWERIQAAVSPNVLAHRICMVRDVDVTKRLQNLQVPICYIQAENDAIVPTSTSKTLVEALPGVLVRKIQGPHFILQAQPALSLAIIEEFNRNLPIQACNRGNRMDFRHVK